MTEEEFRSREVAPALDYMAECDKTASGTFNTHYVDRDGFVRLLTVIAEKADELNLFKKLLFRGKTPKDVGYSHPGLSSSLAVEFPTHDTPTDVINIIHGLVGVITEAGEMAEVLIAGIEKGEFDRVNAMEEAGDVAWYNVRLLRGLNTTLDVMQRMNIDKLRGRHGEAFDQFRDANRDLNAERKRLEEHAAPLLDKIDTAGSLASTMKKFDAERRDDATKAALAVTVELGDCEGTNPADPPKPGVDQGRPIWRDGCWRFEKRPLGDSEGMDA